MGTMINGNKISNFYIAGNKINGFAKNGEIVFKLDITGLVIKLKNEAGKVLPWGYYSHDLYVYITCECNYTATLNGEPYVSGTRIAARGNYTLIVEDEIGNIITKEFGIDKDKPKITGVIDGGEYNEFVIPIITDLNLDIVTLNGETFISGTKISIPGTYNLVAIDKAKNISDITFELTDDETPPVIEILPSSLGSKGYYRLLNLKITDNFAIETLKINDKIINKSGEDIEILDGVDFNFTDGNILIEATDVGNNISQKVMVVDKTAPVIDLSNIPNTFEIGVDIYTYPEPGIATDNLDTSVNFSSVNIEWHKATEDGQEGELVPPFEWDTTLENREPGDYYISYYIDDKAGNRGEAHRILTLYKTGDITPPVYQTLGIFNTTHFSSGGDIHYATNGNNIRVLIWFKEKLEVEPKLALLTNDGYVDLEGNEAFKYSNDGREDVHYYISNFILKDTMNLPEGEIQIKIYDYADAAGNVGETLTNEDINNASYTHVIYDKTPPTILGLNGPQQQTVYIGSDFVYEEQGIQASDNVDGDNYTVLTPDRIDWYGDDGEQIFNYDSKYDEMTYTKPGWYNIIYKAVDRAGNTSINEIDRIINVENPE